MLPISNLVIKLLDSKSLQWRGKKFKMQNFHQGRRRTWASRVVSVDRRNVDDVGPRSVGVGVVWRSSKSGVVVVGSADVAAVAVAGKQETISTKQHKVEHSINHIRPQDLCASACACTSTSASTGARTGARTGAKTCDSPRARVSTWARAYASSFPCTKASSSGVLTII